MAQIRKHNGPVYAAVHKHNDAQECLTAHAHSVVQDVCQLIADVNAIRKTPVHCAFVHIDEPKPGLEPRTYYAVVKLDRGFWSAFPTSEHRIMRDVSGLRISPIRDNRNGESGGRLIFWEAVMIHHNIGIHPKLPGHYKLMVRRPADITNESDEYAKLTPRYAFPRGEFAEYREAPGR